ncbi:thioesterase superfamily protein [Colletotrichum truncatum]|uniref:Thioesterase superfamily protein n=1 Tax=Colletotrichum truncatum TaxID=5467 RepID=A0ACC3Z5R0_COLTU|nr:thioesterase superfamily protein [Colletotrichum truncatum]KAF6795307.1 thioesterase superfamily protein [Colletotrichum truncatum]
MRLDCDPLNKILSISSRIPIYRPQPGLQQEYWFAFMTLSPSIPLRRVFARSTKCPLDARVLRVPAPYRQTYLQRYHTGVGVASVTPRTSNIPRFRKAVAFGAYGLLFAGLGFAVAASPLLPGLWDATRHRSDEDSLRRYIPEDAEAKVVDDFINNHPLAAELRRNPDMVESRPHMRLPDALRRHNLTGGTLLGPGRITVPPLCWTEKDGKSLVSITHFGTDMCGHPGIVHGGLLATILDEGLARCCFGALPHNVGVTANLEINYRKPVHAGTYVVLRARTLRVEGRKAWVEGQLETLAGEGEEPVVLAQATALFVSPRFASVRNSFSDCHSPTVLTTCLQVMAKLNATS